MADKRVQEQATYMALSSLFLTAFALFASRHRKKSDVVDLSGRDLAMLGLATFRLARLASYDKVLEPYRLIFAEVKPDAFGADMTVEPRGEGIRRAIGELVCCPICTGTWISAALVYALHLFPGPARVLMTIMGAIGLGEVLNALTEALHWNAWQARKQVGRG